MSFSVQSFLKTYGTVGVSLYAGATTISMTSIYLVLRSGGGETMIVNPLERMLGKDSDIVQQIKHQLLQEGQQQQGGGDDNKENDDNDNDDDESKKLLLTTESSSTTTMKQQQQQETSSSSSHSFPHNINWIREGTYMGIATLVDSVMLPIKLAVCLPLARYIISRRGRRPGR